jgi:hypothetical protein
MLCCKLNFDYNDLSFETCELCATYGAKISYILVYYVFLSYDFSTEIVTFVFVKYDSRAKDNLSAFIPKLAAYSIRIH